MLDCPVMYDDQNGTAIVVLVAPMVAIILLGRGMSSLNVVGVRRRYRRGYFHESSSYHRCFRHYCARFAWHSAYRVRRHELREVSLIWRDVPTPAVSPATWPRCSLALLCSLGCRRSWSLEELLVMMAPDGIVFVLSDPDPEIHPGVAAKYVAVVAIGRSDFCSQINSVLVFPGVFCGALDAETSRITEKMMVAAVEAIFCVASDDFTLDRIVPSLLNFRVGEAGALATEASDVAG